MHADGFVKIYAWVRYDGTKVEWFNRENRFINHTQTKTAPALRDHRWQQRVPEEGEQASREPFPHQLLLRSGGCVFGISLVCVYCRSMRLLPR